MLPRSTPTLMRIQANQHCFKTDLKNHKLIPNKPPPHISPNVSPLHPQKEGGDEEIKVVTCWANHNIDSLVPSRIIKCFALTT